MLGQRRRRWPNINPALGQCIVCVGSGLFLGMLSRVGTPLSVSATVHIRIAYALCPCSRYVVKPVFFLEIEHEWHICDAL